MEIDREKIENKWREEWKKLKPKVDKEKEKFFITVPIPYPDGPVHLGHGYTWGRADIYARFKRMQGFNVLWPQGFHFTGGPLVGMSLKIKNRDAQLIHVFRDIYQINEKHLESFEDPLALGSYFADRIKKVFETAALSIDWSKEFKTIDPAFQKFIEWQFNHLYSKGLLYKGKHPVIWCPREKTALGDHDRAEGEGESPVKFHIIKFYIDDIVLPAATLRPETVFGVTNLWINPELKYVKAKVDKEYWIVAEEAIIKLENQGKEISEVEPYDIAKLVGRKAKDKVNKKEIPILPADFVTDKGTGVVMSVPAHAPFDYFYLKNANAEFQIIKIIDVPEGLEMEQVLSTFGKDKKGLEEATKYVYRVENERGIMNKNTPFEGIPVNKVEEQVIELLKAHKVYDEIYDTINPVVCRCGAKGIVKIVENQWFIKYSDEEWKKKALKAVERMKIYPEEARNMLINSIINLEDKACTRSGERELGTKFPWDPSQVIEPLSDSTIYMAYYTIADLIKKIPLEKLTFDVFDYIFLNKRDAKIPEEYRETIEEMRKSFEYWYPVDMRVTAKELIPNHITFWIMNHVELFDESKWPKGLQTNGWIKINEVKMSKSKGNGILIEDFLQKEGVDKLRMIACLGNGIDDENISLEELKAYDQKINFLLSVVELLNAFERKDKKLIDKYLLSEEQELIKAVTENLESFRFRNALVLAFFEGIEKLKWYLEAGGNNRDTVEEYITTLTKLLHPIFPVITEEINTIFNTQMLEAYKSWPAPDTSKIDENVERAFKIVKQTIEDINSIIATVGKTPEKIEIYIAKKEKFDEINKILEEKEKGKSIKEISKEITNKGLIKLMMKKGLEKIPTYEDEKEAFNESKNYIGKLFSCQVEIKEDHDEAIPNRPKINVVWK
jgi:leucyl-tRNA synthetase